MGRFTTRRGALGGVLAGAGALALTKSAALAAAPTSAARAAPRGPRAEWLYDATALLGKDIPHGRTIRGERLRVEILGGEFAGPTLLGKIIPGGTTGSWSVPTAIGKSPPTISWKRTMACRSMCGIAAYGRSGGIRRAAALLCVDHSAVSRHLKALESFVEASLIDRKAASGLTAAGQRYHTAVSQSLSLIEAETSHLRQSRRDKLTLWCVPGLAFQWMLPRLRDFTDAHPHNPDRTATFGFAAKSPQQRSRWRCAVCASRCGNERSPLPHHRTGSASRFSRLYASLPRKHRATGCPRRPTTDPHPARRERSGVKNVVRRARRHSAPGRSARPPAVARPPCAGRMPQWPGRGAGQCLSAGGGSGCGPSGPPRLRWRAFCGCDAWRLCPDDAAGTLVGPARRQVPAMAGRGDGISCSR